MFPKDIFEPMVTIHTLSPEAGVGLGIFNGANVGMDGYSSSAWPAGANTAVFIPFLVGKEITFSTMFWVNGTVVSGNVDVGVYSQDGTKIVSKGSTAQSGTSAIQIVTVTTTTIGPGLYYLALVLDNATGTIASYPIGQVLKTKFTGAAQMASAFALPSSATFATLGQDSLPLVGLSTRSTI